MSDKQEQQDSHLRSILKAFTWRVVATTTTATIAYFIIGEIGSALAIGGIEFFVKMFVYYLHERAWSAAPRVSLQNVVSMPEAVAVNEEGA